MLQVNEIRENKEKFIQALIKRGFDASIIFDDVLQTDELRKITQAKLDETLAQSNSFSKEIGLLYKNGETHKATLLKEKTSQLKEESKKLNDKIIGCRLEIFFTDFNLFLKSELSFIGITDT